MVVVANPWQFSGDVFFGGGFGKTMVGRILRTKLLSSLQLSNEKTLVGWAILGIMLPRYIGISINHYKDPY